MQTLISETFESRRFPAHWQLEGTPHHTVASGGLRSGRATGFWIPLPGPGWHILRVELDIQPIVGAAIACGDGVTQAVLHLKGVEYPRHEIRKYRHRLGVSTTRIPDRPGVRRLAFEFDHGRTRMEVDGIEVLSAMDPFPRPFMGWLRPSPSNP